MSVDMEEDFLEEIPERPAGVPEDAILRTIRVPPESAGMRLDRFLSTQLRATSRTRAQAIIDVSAFSWDGRRLRASERVRAEQQVVLWRPALDEAPPPHEVRTLHEDPHLLVVNKPPLMTVHPTARHHKQTVIKVLEAERPTEHLSLIHRLDRETSGVLLVARSKEADRTFKTRLEQRSLAAARAASRGEEVDGPADKSYLAITWGIPKEGLVTAPLEADPSPLRVKMSVAEKGNGLAARTGVTVLAQVEGYALVRCELHTGRQHQIRVHLAHIGTPVVGDKLYGPDERLLARGADNELTEDDLVALELPRHALHAAEYRLTHPFTGETLRLRAPLPEDMRNFWRSKGGTLPPEVGGD
jgi:23S rRNA pseudouridine1911/1915/1917 synthase